MNELSTDVKKQKLNIFQKIRLKLYRRNTTMSFEQYSKAPEYVKRDTSVVRSLKINNNLSIDQLLQIPSNILLCEKSDVQKFSLVEQAKLIKQGYISKYQFSKEELNAIVMEDLLNSDNYDIFSDWKLDYHDMQEFSQFLKTNNLYDELIPDLIEHCDERTKLEIVEEKPELLSKLSEEEQIKSLIQKPNNFSYMSPELQVKYMETDSKYINEASIQAQTKFVEKNSHNIIKLNRENQFQLVSENPQLFAYLTKDMQIKYQLDNFEKLNDKQLIDIALYSRRMGAIGSLSTSDNLLHGTDAGEKELLSDQYTYSQFQRFQKLTTSQIANLIQIDTNYILPYVGKKADPKQSYNDNIFTNTEKEQSKKRCEEVFLYMFGAEKLQIYKQSIEMIYDMQMKKQETFRKQAKVATGGLTQEQYEQLLQKEKNPLEELKILFNEKIINSNSPELIEKYLQEKSEGRDAQIIFKNIIANAYGKQAEAILESRPNLNVHSINSLEVFDERILGRFGDAFVHDCISYNLLDFSAFLHVMKNPERADDFKTYYEVLSEIYGKNVDTMQKAMSEFHGVETLLANIRDVELTDKQYDNLISVLCIRNNPLHVETLQELQKYDQIVNKKMEEIINSPNASADNIKKNLCTMFLGIDYYNKPDYGRSLEFITSLYDVQGETTRSENYTKEEQQMLQILDFLSKEENLLKIGNLSKEIMKINSDGMHIPVVLQTAVQKTIQNQTGILNESLTSLDTLKKEAEKTHNSKEGKVYYETLDGLEFYHLNGIGFNFLAHAPGEFSKDLTVTYEGQAGNGALCCRIASDKLGDIYNKYIYTQVDDGMVIAADNADANTQHRAKRVVNYGRVNRKMKNISEMTSSLNEVAQNRRYKNHEKVNNKTHGGRVMPDAYGKYASEEVDEEEKEFCKKYHIPIIIVHGDKYKEKIKKEQTPKNEILDNESGR